MSFEPTGAGDGAVPELGTTDAADKKPSIRTFDPLPSSVEQDLSAMSLNDPLPASQSHLHDPDYLLAVDPTEQRIPSGDPTGVRMSLGLLEPGPRQFPSDSHGSGPSLPQEPSVSTGEGTFTSLPDTNVFFAPVQRERHRLVELHADQNDSTGLGSSLRPLPLFPWKFEFYWDPRRGHLLFDQARLVVQSEPVTTDELSIVAVLEESGDVAETDSIDVLSDAEGERSCRDDETNIPTHIRWMFTELLEDWYWRRRRPQRTEQKTTNPGEGSNGYYSEQSGGSSHVSAPNRSTNSRQPGHPNGSEDGDEGDHDEGGGDDRRQGPTQMKTNLIPYRRFACPYYKWDPDNFAKKCKGGFDKMTSVKEHLQRKHQPLYCEGCYTTFEEDEALQQHGRLLCARIPLEKRSYQFMIKEQRDWLTKRLDGNVLPEDQWRDIYRNLFPCSSRTPSPYLSGKDIVSFPLYECEALLRRFGRDLMCETARGRLAFNSWIQPQQEGTRGLSGANYDSLSTLEKEQVDFFIERVLRRNLNLVAPGGDRSPESDGGGLAVYQSLPDPRLITGPGFPEASGAQQSTGFQNYGNGYVADTRHHEAHRTPRLSENNILVASNNRMQEQVRNFLAKLLLSLQLDVTDKVKNNIRNSQNLQTFNSASYYQVQHDLGFHGPSLPVPAMLHALSRPQFTPPGMAGQPPMSNTTMGGDTVIGLPDQNVVQDQVGLELEYPFDHSQTAGGLLADPVYRSTLEHPDLDL